MQRSRLYGWICAVLGFILAFGPSMSSSIDSTILFVAALYFLHQAACERARKAARERALSKQEADSLRNQSGKLF